MAVVVFVLGRPGSGKSQVARCIKGDESPAASGIGEEYSPEDREVVHITDYKYLLRMFQEEQRLDPEERCFEPSEHDGFNVTEFGFSHAVLDKALEQVNIDILQEIENEQEQKQKLILVEFARSNYRNIKNVFDTKILESASVLYLQADLEICVGRVHQRVRFPLWEDDSFVSDDIMKGYYQEEEFADLREIFGMNGVEIIDNNGEWKGTWVEVKKSIEKFCLVCKRDPIEQPVEKSASFSAESSSIELSLEPSPV